MQCRGIKNQNSHHQQKCQNQSGSNSWISKLMFLWYKLIWIYHTRFWKILEFFKQNLKLQMSTKPNNCTYMTYFDTPIFDTHPFRDMYQCANVFWQVFKLQKVVPSSFFVSVHEIRYTWAFHDIHSSTNSKIICLLPFLIGCSRNWKKKQGWLSFIKIL